MNTDLNRFQAELSSERSTSTTTPPYVVGD